MNEDYSTHWLEEIVKEIYTRKPNEITLSTGKTPSGHIHLGILREIIICDALRRIFENDGKKVNNLLFFDSLDAAKRFPPYIDKDFQIKHLGKPFAMIPCPYEDCKCKSYAYHFGNELTDVFPDFGIKIRIIWSHDLYKTKKMQEKIKIALENTEKIKKILRKYIIPTLKKEDREEFIEMQKDWMPVMAICEKCNRIQHLDDSGSIKPNRIKKYFQNEEVVSYECEACGYKGKISIWSGRLKLNWRVDWPAKWALFRTTCEPAGKDHSVKGGAYDTGIELCQVLYNYEGPVKVPYEWLRLGDQDMGTSKGHVFTPKNYLTIADPRIYRTIILRTNPIKHITFRIEEIPQYYDYYERMEDIYYDIESTENFEESKFFKYIFPLTQINHIPESKLKRIPLKILIFLTQIQNILSLEKLYEKAKSYMEKHNFKHALTMQEFKHYFSLTSNWIKEVKEILESEKDPKIKKDITRKLELFTIPKKVDEAILNKMDSKQIKGIRLLREYFEKNDSLEANSIQNKIFSIAKDEINIPPKKFFEIIYQIILGNKSGPRLGPFLSLLDKSWILERLDI
ncbi:MAG: lysine--tRNA ligase [Candidatus Hermodarchaeota archaeon]